MANTFTNIPGIIEPMNFIAEDNIYYPFESLVKIHAIALKHRNYYGKYHAKVNVEYFCSVILSRMLEKHICNECLCFFSSSFGKTFTQQCFKWNTFLNPHIFYSFSFAFTHTYVIISRSIIHKEKLKINYAHVFLRKCVAVTRQLRKKETERITA